ncbi:hypothetical protein E1301_Tti005254 [Triplophysa tibetana]|uniref:Uncharacterized protein n=1 Tax=Triplophysa tibetana TaxID=1572043 RepID=A0A5A9PMV9_9TELE|nr:hypothetical protein E1301_Tti005254 [Triplophysa tibetana]
MTVLWRKYLRKRLQTGLQHKVIQSSATRLVQVHWLEVIVRLHLHHRGPLLSDGGNIVEDGTCNNNVTGPVRCNPQTLKTLKSSFSWSKVISMRGLVLARAAL